MKTLHALLGILPLLVLLGPATSSVAAQETDGHVLGRTLDRALKLLSPPPPVPIRFVDPELVADPNAVRRVDAFTVRETDGRIRPVIYLNPRAEVIRRAARGRQIDVAILASVIRHELEHLRGGAEPQARAAEREFFQRLIFTGEVPQEEGLRYLPLLGAYQHAGDVR